MKASTFRVRILNPFCSCNRAVPDHPRHFMPILLWGKLFYLCIENCYSEIMCREHGISSSYLSEKTSQKTFTKRPPVSQASQNQDPGAGEIALVEERNGRGGLAVRSPASSGESLDQHSGCWYDLQ